jgi:S-DNA-T family DNA segregation ATPase FtsK/SpoIIIE
MSKKRKKRRHIKQKSAYKVKLKKGQTHAIAQAIFFGLAGLMLISFSRSGGILIAVNDFLIKYFGIASLFLPFIFLVFGFLVSRFKNPLSSPNVLVGSMLFFLAFATLFQAGQFGTSSWEGISALITPVGTVLIMLITIFIGMVILFNTSVDQSLVFIADLFRQTKRIIVADKKQLAKGVLNKREMKVLGGGAPPKIGGMVGNQNIKQSSAPVEPLESKLVSNLPGDEKVWKYPPIDIFTDTETGKADRGDIKGNAAIIEQTLDSFGITARVVEVNLGPAVTQYAIEVALGTKLSKITALERDLALALAAPTGTIRIEAPIPGRSLVGIELPNRSPEFVPLKKMLQSDVMSENSSKLAVAMGLDVSGKPIVATISKMPHVLIAGQTGSGKSVCLNTFLASILFRASPSEVKFILVDPKRVELTGYNGIPHLLTPVIVEPEKVVSALRWVMAEMDRRYKLFAEAGVRNMDGYNEMSGFQALPYIVVVIDELADIMLFSPAEVEDAVTRIAQMSRATGIHMVLATQRPSVDIITGLIKANIPFRIAFAVSSLIDSRVILDTPGAEKLLGKGDMLYLSADQAKPSRVQGAYVSDKDINALVNFVKNQGIPAQYTEEVTSMKKAGTSTVPGVEGDMDDLFRQAVEIVCQYDRASASLLQRRLSIGYARAARILDQLEAAGVVSASDGSSKPREVLVQNAQEFLSGNSQPQEQ